MTPEHKQDFKQKFIHKFENELRSVSKNVHTVVMSSEHFHSRLRSEAELDNVYNLLSAHFDEIKIVCYLREQVSMCTSFYSTHMRNSGTESFAKFLQRCHPENLYFNYYEMLENWGRCFGFDALEVSLFSPKHFLNGDLLDDFTAKIDVRLVGKLNKLVDAENESLRPLGQALSRAINIALPATSERLEIGELRARSKKIIIEKFTGKGQQPALKVRQKFFESFLDCNEELRKKYFPTVETLFETPVEAVLTESAISKTDFDALIDVLSVFKKYIDEKSDADLYTSLCSAISLCIGDATKSGSDVTEFSNEVILQEKDAYLFRSAAKRMEKDNLGAAVRLLRLASDLRPNWTAIQSQLDDYRQRSLKAQMPRFMIAYHGGPKVMTPSIKDIYMRFDAWLASLNVPFGGHLISANDSKSVDHHGLVVDIDADRMVGYSIIEADSMDAVLSLVKNCPFLEADGTVRISQLEYLTGGW